MVLINLFKNINPICISKKIGLYLKNPNENILYKYVNEIVKDEFYINSCEEKNYRKKVIEYFKDEFYKNSYEEDISKFNSRQLVKFITKRLIVLDVEVSNNTIIVDDGIFDLYDEKSIAKALRSKPLLNPIDEYEIEYKIIYLFNFLRHVHSKRNELDILFYNGYPNDRTNEIFNDLFFKTFKGRKIHEYFMYQYYSNSEYEFKSKINDFIKFGSKIDQYIECSNDFFKLDFIIEILLAADENIYAFLNYIELIEMLIINPKRSIRDQFKEKIKFFMNQNEFKCKEDIEDFSVKLYDIRSRLVHGNYNTLKKELINFNKKYNKNVNYDYGEFKEQNWIMINISFKLKKILRNIIEIMLEDKNKLYDFKMDLINKI